MSEPAADPSVTIQAERTAKSGTVDALRRRTVISVARFLIGCAAIGFVPAAWMLASGQYVPFIAVMIALAAGFAVHALPGGAGDASAVRVLLISTAGLGALHAVLDPHVSDFGLATALLVPVMAALLADRSSQKLSWVLSVSALAAGAFTAGLFEPMTASQSAGIAWSAAVSYGVAAIAVALAAVRLGAALDTLDKAQIETFRHLVENIHFGVVRLSAKGQPVFVSETATSLLGCNRFELAGEGLVERVHVQDRPAYLKALSDSSRSDTPRTIEVRMRRDDDEGAAVPQFAWIECAMSPVNARAAARDGKEVMVLLRDISHRIEQQEEMSRAHQLAQDASEAKSRFLATIGHELRTPLNAIVGFSDMMRTGISGELSDTHREYADLINKSGMHLLDTVNMLLDMSRIEAGKFDLQLESFEPETLLGPCIGMVEPMARTRRVSVSAELAPGLPKVVGDERAFRQIIINLLSNAVKFSHPGGEVRLNMARQGNSLAISVADDGIGMSPDVTKRLGEPFFQAQDGLSREFEGTGLGLSIVKGLVELHDGRLQVVSRASKGTTMTVVMPLAGPEERAEPKVLTSMPERRPATTKTDWSERRSAAI